MSKIADLVYEMVEPIAAEQGVELVDVEYVKEGGLFILRVFIDREGEGVTIDDCQHVSRNLSKLLDEKDPIQDNYMLEVSSPGIDRPLKKDQDFVRFAGSNIDISTYAPVHGQQKKFTAELVGLKDDNIVVKVEDDEEIEIPRDKVSQVRLAVEF